MVALHNRRRVALRRRVLPRVLRHGLSERPGRHVTLRTLREVHGGLDRAEERRELDAFRRAGAQAVLDLGHLVQEVGARVRRELEREDEVVHAVQQIGERRALFHLERLDRWVSRATYSDRRW